MTQKNIVFKLKENENSFTLTFSNESSNSEINNSEINSNTPAPDALGISISEEGSVPPINYSAKFT